MRTTFSNRLLRAAVLLLTSWFLVELAFGQSCLTPSFGPATTNWRDVSTLPTTNYTNLKYEVPVTFASGTIFYRLRAK